MIVLIPWEEFTKETVMEKVNKGDTCIVVKDGKKIIDFKPHEDKTPSWKREIKRIRLKPGKSSTELLREERDS
ncbi:MAG: hypothetical protein JXR70_10445 [Spirochaetales bacterium]|nr:hypothetical protein [Spirochaetales bacterium]